jgi:hypothetical protein
LCEVTFDEIDFYAIITMRHRKKKRHPGRGRTGLSKPVLRRAQMRIKKSVASIQMQRLVQLLTALAILTSILSFIPSKTHSQSSKKLRLHPVDTSPIQFHDLVDWFGGIKDDTLNSIIATPQIDVPKILPSFIKARLSKKSISSARYILSQLKFQDSKISLATTFLKSPISPWMI